MKSLLLLIIRERQIGIRFSPEAQAARALAAAEPSLAAWRPYIDMADFVSSGRQGIQTDISMVQVRFSFEDVPKYQAELKAKAAGDEFFAYLYLVFYGSRGGYGDFRKENPEDFSIWLKAFPHSPLLQYLEAVRLSSFKSEILEKLAASDPEFHEAHFHLGEAAMGERKLLSAETCLLRSLPGLEDSPQPFMMLATIYTATEESEKSLEYYDRTLARSPEYRDALLGKAISLSSLGRYPEAITVLNKMTVLGFWLLGEANYWLAWNHHELKGIEAAQKAIEESKTRLPMNSEVFGLAGTIALENGQLERAEKDFKEALRYNAGNLEALFGLARISDQRQAWKDSAGYYERAADKAALNETEILARIDQIKTADLDSVRRARMLARKEKQLETTRLTRAAAEFNAGAAWVNFGQKDRALPLLDRAGGHPQYKGRAAELKARIKS
jgi:tetratricopeptide (TPR) repeat protein